ncbi:unnamed protein product [Ectocarpus sp. 4 AP-2014]
MSAAAAGATGTSPTKQGNGNGSKRPHEEQPLNTPADGKGTGPPPSKTSKANSSEDKKKDEVQPTPASGGGRAVVPVKAEGAQPTDSERVEAECLRSLGMAVGTRLEVMWLLEDDDKSVEKWWGCSVAGAKTGERDEEEGRPVFTLHYDAYEAFEEADHDVCFVDRYRLVHLEDGAEMTWKREGEEVDREAVLASLADEDVNLQEVMAAQEEEDANEGAESVETRSMKAIAQLPPHQQAAMTAGYRRMADVIKEHLRAKITRTGGETVVSEADVENMFRDVRGSGGSSGSF